ncbi:EGF-like domain protein, partial [Ostertagia ostertagi]
CGLRSCQHLCVRSTKNRFECFCAQGYTLKGERCQVSSETLLLAGDKLISTVNGSNPAFVLHPTIAFKQWRKIAIDHRNDLVVAFFSVVDTVQSEIVIGDENLYIIQR